MNPPVISRPGEILMITDQSPSTDLLKYLPYHPTYCWNIIRNIPHSGD